MRGVGGLAGLHQRFVEQLDELCGRPAHLAPVRAHRTLRTLREQQRLRSGGT
jgi:hypothetical protein